MSLGRLLAMGAVTAALLAPVAVQAQTTTRPIDTRLDRGRPVVVTPGRPTVIDREPVRPRGERGDRGDRGADGEHLRERLRNACFNDPNPPAPLCRRVFGDQ